MAKAQSVPKHNESTPSNPDPPGLGTVLRVICPQLDPAGVVTVSISLSVLFVTRGVTDPLALGLSYGMAVFSICAYLYSLKTKP
jgi:hypothetical protein